MAKVGGLLKLDAICAKLKTNLETKPGPDSVPVRPEDEGTVLLGQKDTGCEEDAQLHTEPNNNTQTAQLSQVKGHVQDLITTRSSSAELEGEDDQDRNLVSVISDSPGSLHQPGPGVEKVNLEMDLTTGSRKNRRKAQRPRSIAHVESVEQPKDELVEYELNNPEMDFDSICEAAMEEDEEEEEEEAVHSGTEAGLMYDREEDEDDNSLMMAYTDGQQLEDSDDEDEDYYRSVRHNTNMSSNIQPFAALESHSTSTLDSSSGALDLSVTSRPLKPPQTRTPSKRQGTLEELSSEENGVLNLSISPKSEAPSVPPTARRTKPASKSVNDEVEMKDYAENTMNELLNMYGLGGEGETISSNVPLKHFSPGSILDRGSPMVSQHAQSALQGMRGLTPSMLLNLQGQRSQQQRSLGHRSVPRSPRPELDEDLSTPTGTPTVGDNVTGGSPFMKSCFESPMSPSSGNELSVSPNTGRILLPDYYKYLKRYNSHEECGGNHCEDMGYKEHYHCLDCSFRVFVKKEEMIRHFKWHKKRDESLQHGFMRYSPMDDCSKKFAGACSHNGKQTHYHCIQMGCSKVYISTSDVQMHANYHRKDSAILQEGFQRFRATEDCGTMSCAFYNQRTTHFHCRRPGCSFTFKNKADMEKHKTYHQKDEILAKDGFKKFMKYEYCNYNGCRYSKASNHIHCIRPGCHYVLHSTGQLYSHKRKHERRDFEHAYKRFKDEQQKVPAMSVPSLSMGGASSVVSMLGGASSAGGLIGTPALPVNKYTDDLMKMRMRMSLPPPAMMEDSDDSSVTSEPEDMSLSSVPDTPHQATLISGASMSVVKEEPQGGATVLENKALPSTLARLASKINGSGEKLSDSLSLPIPVQSVKMENLVTMATPVSGLRTTVSASSVSQSPVDIRAPSPQMAVCPTSFVPKVSPPVNEKKERDESWKKYLTRYTANDPCHSRCQFLYKDHYHCNTVNCGMLFRSKDGVREHAKFHEQQDRITSLTFMSYDENTPCPEKCQHSHQNHYHCLWTDCKHVIAASDPVFSRMEHYKIHEYSRATTGRRVPVTRPIVESFKRRRGRPPKYPKSEIPMVPKLEMAEPDIIALACRSSPGDCIISGFKKFSPADPCPDDKCMFFMKEHYHCLRPRCHHSTDRYDVLNLHAKDFHSYITILDGFEFFDRTINCRRPHCHNNRANRHFHCVRPRCDYSFVRVSTMAQHDKKHRMVEMGLTHSASVAVPKILLPAKGAPIMPGPGSSQPVSIAPMPQGIVRASGTFFPVPNLAKPKLITSAGMVQVSNNAPIMVAVPQPNSLYSNGTTTTTKMTPLVITPVNSTMATPGATQLITIAPMPAQNAAVGVESTQALMTQCKPSTTSALSSTVTRPSTNALPLTMLLQQKATKLMPQPSWITLLLKMHYGAKQNCGRPFCKLKKKDHYHCFDCNQAFSDPSRLKGHVIKHGFHVDKSDFLQGRVLPMTDSVVPPGASIADDGANSGDPELSDSEPELEAAESSNVGGSLNLHAGTFSNLLQKGLEQDDKLISQPKQSPKMKKNIEHSQTDQAEMVMDLSMPTKLPTEQASVGVDQPTAITQSNATTDSPAHSEEPMYDPNFLQSLGLRKASTGSDEDDSHSTRRSGRKRIATKRDDFVDSGAALAKVRRISSPRQSVTSPRVRVSSPKFAIPTASTVVSTPQAIVSKPKPIGPSPPQSSVTLKPSASVAQNSPSTAVTVPKREEVVPPEGYRKYKFNEDCKFERCAYRQSQSHYHCVRIDCGYAFCDRSRFTQHNERHKRIADLMGEEFQQYRTTIDCGRGDCEFKLRSSHFHCLKCPFICTDSGKVGAHRKHHAKMDNVSAQGFQKYSQSEICPVAGCSHANKHTHYHCTQGKCHQVALGPAQMSAHKVMHDNQAA